MPFVEITLIAGRTDEQKRKLFESVTTAVETSLGAPRESIRVVLREVPAAHWAVGGVPKG
jgi:4-oxalocrotonate tautomerase